MSSHALVIQLQANSARGCRSREALQDELSIQPHPVSHFFVCCFQCSLDVVSPHVLPRHVTNMFFMLCWFWITTPLQQSCPTCDHIMSWASKYAAPWCGTPGASLLLPPFPGLQQQLVKVTVIVKIKEMPAAFMSFLWLFPLSFGYQPPSSFHLFSCHSFSSTPTVRVTALCETQFGLICHDNPFFAVSLFIPAAPFSSPLACFVTVYSLETSPSQFSDPVFSRPLNWDDLLHSMQPGGDVTLWQATLNAMQSPHQRATQTLSLNQGLSKEQMCNVLISQKDIVLNMIHNHPQKANVVSNHS